MQPSRRTDWSTNAIQHLPSISRSGGQGGVNDSLKEDKVQEEYRAYIDTKIAAFEASYDRTKSSTLNQSQQDALSDILILLRKLREGILSSHRVDAFAINAYETSAHLSILANNHTMTTRILSVLVPDLYLAHSQHLLASSSSKTNTNTKSNIPPTTTASHPPNLETYTTLHLLHLLLTSYPSQRPYTQALHHLPPSFLPPSSSHFQRLRKVASLLHTHNFYAFSLLVLSPSQSQSRHPDIQLLLLALLARVREYAWSVTRVAYREFVVSEWLRVVLGFGENEDEGLGRFLREKVQKGEVTAAGGKYVIVRTVKAKT